MYVKRSQNYSLDAVCYAFQMTNLAAEWSADYAVVVVLRRGILNELSGQVINTVLPQQVTAIESVLKAMPAAPRGPR